MLFCNYLFNKLFPNKLILILTLTAYSKQRYIHIFLIKKQRLKMKKFTGFVFAIILFLPVSLLFSQAYQGPAAGSVASGVEVTTDIYSRTIPIKDPVEKIGKNKLPHNDVFQYDASIGDVNIQNSVFVEDASISRGGSVDTAMTILLKSFNGINQTNSIPPDPHIAAGPNHIVATVNSRFAIWDKEGNLIKNIDADQWYNSVHPGVGAFDPKILYDHHDERWIMVWLDQNDNNSTGYFLISVSDDSDPTGTWYNWLLPSHVNGTTVVNNWGDYQGVGFDKDAIYITANQFQFGGSFQYVKIRVVPKAQLYANTAGPVVWNDLWDIRYPHNPSSRPFNIRPSIIYGEPSEYYLMHAPNGGGNFMTIFKITDPLTTPVLTSVNVPVSNFNPAPNANQLGGSSILIEGAGSALRNEPTYRNGKLWAVHSIRNTTSSPNSSIRYVKIDVAANTALEDVEFGAPAFWHFYGALAVDQDENIAITYSRSGDDEYIGAYYTTRLADDPPGLNPSSILQTGKGNYVKDFGSGRNRWGDYNGIWLDPEDQNNFWMFTEFASAANTWGTWAGQIRLVPFPGTYVLASINNLDFGDVEADTESDVITTTIQNLGVDELIISSIPVSVGNFTRVSDHSFPITLSSYETTDVQFSFAPQDSGLFNEFFPITSNDLEFTGLNLTGNAYVINEAVDEVIYAGTGTSNSGNMFTINPTSGTASLLGASRFSEIKSLTINPKTNVMYGMNSEPNSTRLFRVNANGGDGYSLHTLSEGNMASIAFDTSGVLYAAKRTGEFFTVDLEDGSLTSVFNSGITISGIAFNPVNNELWASFFAVVGANRDKLIKIDKATGDTTLVGGTGLAAVTNDLFFDGSGNLFGVKGTSNQPNDFFSINKETGAGTIIGSTGQNHIQTVAMLPSSITSIAEGNEAEIPTQFTLSQNYPNPFNPSTTINFGLPANGNVKLVVYNLLGEVVNILIDEQRNAGFHQVIWNSNDSFGRQVTSGIYFYEVKAVTDDGKEFSQMRKMILLK
jgi:hypothetical protein